MKKYKFKIGLIKVKWSHSDVECIHKFIVREEFENNYVVDYISTLNGYIPGLNLSKLNRVISKERVFDIKEFECTAWEKFWKKY